MKMFTEMSKYRLLIPESDERKLNFYREANRILEYLNHQEGESPPAAVASGETGKEAHT